MLLACDPALLLNGREEVLRCQRVVEGHAKHLEERPDGVSATEASRQIWEAQVSGSRPASRRSSLRRGTRLVSHPRSPSRLRQTASGVVGAGESRTKEMEKRVPPLPPRALNDRSRVAPPCSTPTRGSSSPAPSACPATSPTTAPVSRPPLSLPFLVARMTAGGAGTRPPVARPWAGRPVTVGGRDPSARQRGSRRRSPAGRRWGQLMDGTSGRPRSDPTASAGRPPLEMPIVLAGQCSRASHCKGYYYLAASQNWGQRRPPVRDGQSQRCQPASHR